MSMSLLEFITILVLFDSLCFSPRLSTASPLNHQYNVGDPVPLFVNKVGPLTNPSETYQYYELPFCRPDPVVQKKATLGEVLNGDRLNGALHVIKFREEKPWETLCEKKLKGAEVSLFRDAVRNDFYFQLYWDDLPVWGFVGKIDEQSWSLDKQGPKCSGGDEEDEKEVVWKYLHGDVFRCPQNLPLFSAVLGVGTQLLTMFCCLFLLAFLGILYPYNRGSLFTSIILIYSLTSAVSGYVSASFHCQFAEIGWERSVILSGILYLGPSFVIISILNIIAISNGTTAALPIGTIIVILLIYVFISLPLLVFGGIIGHRFRSEFQAPCATKRNPREIPPLAWFRKLPCQMFISGLLSFSAVVLELHHLYASMWGFKIFTLPSILFITFIILIILTAILSVGLTYIQLSVEDHQWWWRSVFSGGSAAIFMFGYCIYFYARSNMNGFLQLCFFVGYNACICYAFFLMLGVISFRVSLIFVRRIYDAVKSE
ncbi:transmembrane 9 superfamily member 5 isoform X4 [Cucumis melo]|uniref:Transmembrane 9 superfamily member n=1 Tax=Cucumis melo TaxID=3656 RepID=A0A1S3CFD9_CUCME|nr:transmembrane 9 superfamily member 5 isoform X4 [Cucumis melo]